MPLSKSNAFRKNKTSKKTKKSNKMNKSKKHGGVSKRISKRKQKQSGAGNSETLTEYEVNEILNMFSKNFERYPDKKQQVKEQLMKLKFQEGYVNSFGGEPDTLNLQAESKVADWFKDGMNYSIE